MSRLKKLFDPEILRKNFSELKRRCRAKYWNIVRPSEEPPVFLVGCSRSGTTVTYETLASSRQLVSVGYEIPQFWHRLHGPEHNNWASEAADAEQADPSHRRAFFRYFYAQAGQGRILDKSCINVMRIPYLYALFPEASFVYIYRDGRANVSSLMDGWNMDVHFALRQYLGALPEKVLIDDGRFDDWRFFLPPDWRTYNASSLEEVCAYQWYIANRMALDARKLIPPEQWIEFAYEDLLDKPVETFGHVFQRLGLDFTDELKGITANLAKRPTSIVAGNPDRDKWKKRNGDAVERISDTIAPMMQELGYE